MDSKRIEKISQQLLTNTKSHKPPSLPLLNTESIEATGLIEKNKTREIVKKDDFESKGLGKKLKEILTPFSSYLNEKNVIYYCKLSRLFS